MMFIRLTKSHWYRQWFSFERSPKAKLQTSLNTAVEENVIKHHSEAVQNIQKAQRNYFLTRGTFL